MVYKFKFIRNLEATKDLYITASSEEEAQNVADRILHDNYVPKGINQAYIDNDAFNEPQEIDSSILLMNQIENIPNGVKEIKSIDDLDELYF